MAGITKAAFSNKGKAKAIRVEMPATGRGKRAQRPFTVLIPIRRPVKEPGPTLKA